MRDYSALILPAMLVVFGLIVVPIVRAFWMSLHTIDLTRPAIGQPFVGLEEIVTAGDIVLVGQYNLEQVEVDGEKLYLTRIYDIRGHERVAPRARAAA